MMIDLAENGSEKFTPLKTIAERQGLSLKYVGRIIPELSNAGLLEGVQGRGGGYRLCRRPSEYTVGEILRLKEGNLAPDPYPAWSAMHRDVRRKATAGRLPCGRVSSGSSMIILTALRWKASCRIRTLRF